MPVYACASAGPANTRMCRSVWGTVAVVRRTPGLWRLIAAVAAAAPLAGCDLPGFGAPDPKSEEGESIFSLWQGFFIASIFVALLVWGLIIFSIVRYRRRNEEIPSQKPYNVPGEPGEPPEMVLPLGRPVQLELISTDVNHAFWVPDFLSKRDLIPGVENSITVTPTETGSYIGRCAEFCGLDHWQMYFSVRVVPEDEYEAWIDDQQSDG